MRSNTIVFLVGLMAAPLSIVTSPILSTQANPLVTPAAAVSDTVNGHVLAPAPTPDIGPQGVDPANRVAGAGTASRGSGPIDSTPFSGTPTGAADQSLDSPRAARDLAFQPPGTPLTPDLNR